MDVKSIKTKKKTRQTAQKPPLRDVFTVICKTDLNVECVKEYQFHPVRKWRFDYALPEHKIALEVEGGVWSGGRHTSPQGFLGDIDKYNTATLMGWRVFRTTPDHLYKTALIEMLRQAIGGTFDPQGDFFYSVSDYTVKTSRARQTRISTKITHQNKKQ